MARTPRIEYAGANYHENGAGLVAARANGGVAAEGWPAAGDEALQPGEAGRGPDETATRKEIAGAETVALGRGSSPNMKKYCHFSRTLLQRRPVMS